MVGTPEQIPFANIQAEWARLAITSLAEAGVRDVVISPGSRSTPFVLAASLLAEDGPDHTDGAREQRLQLRLHDVVDERAAAFYALGQARLTGRPSLLLCTSGTAAAHYLPAVIEARMTGVPMLILSADRPLDLLGCGANQTIDQTRLFGEHANAFFELGLADPHPGALRGARRRLAQAYFATGWPRAGAVQINARARKPLEPGGDSEWSDIHRRVDRLLAKPLVRARRPSSTPNPGDMEALAGACRGTRRGLLVAGPAAVANRAFARQIATLSRRTGFPLLADLASQIRGEPQETEYLRVPAFEILLRSSAWARLEPDLILQIGRAPTATAWVKNLAARVETTDSREAPQHWVLAGLDWQDPESTATDILAADLGPTLRTLLESLDDLDRSTGDWQRTWVEMASHVEEAVASVLDTVPAPESGTELSEAHVAAEAVAALPENAHLTLGNSLTIRHADLFGGLPARGVSILSQRGASGIDGLVAGAAGAASIAAVEDPTYTGSLVLLGDVSLQHDLGGLMLAPRNGPPFIVLVIENGGGRIFEQLPIASRIDAATLGHWITPSDGENRDFAHAAAFAGFDFRVAASRDELHESLAQAFRDGGAWLIEARVPPSGAVDLRRQLDREMAKRLDAVESDP